MEGEPAALAVDGARLPVEDAREAAQRKAAGAVEPPAVVRAGSLSATLSAGAVRWIRCGGVEVVRGIDYPIRDADWGTLPTRTEAETLDETAEGFRYRRTFTVGDGLMTGAFNLEGTPGALVASLELTARTDMTVNRAGFVVLHPLDGVAGTPAEVSGPRGTDAAEFPALVSPGQPMRDIVGLAHTVHGVPVRIRFEGEVFETEDQRNWTDASFKTYCRPLALPRPYTVAAGEVIRQRVAIAVDAAAEAAVRSTPAAAEVVVPAITLALDPALSPLDDAPVAALAAVAFDGVQVRISEADARGALADAATLRLPLDLEIVVPPDEPLAALEAVAAACREAGVRPRRVVALPAGYLASVQPEGPWPEGATPAEAAVHARAAFPNAEVGAGVLTNFTELNRCRPAFPSDFVTFGTAAIVHAADDASVVETLEALPAVFATARAIAGDRPLRLGLCAIAMRSNPYGSGLAANPDGARVTMTAADPRHAAAFAAAFAVGLAAAAARAGVAGFSPAMATGPLGLVKPGRVVPLFHVVRALAALSGHRAAVEGGPGGLLVLRSAAPGRVLGVATNLSADPVPLPPGAVAVPDGTSPPTWLDDAMPAGGTLAPISAAILFAEADA